VVSHISSHKLTRHNNQAAAAIISMTSTGSLDDDDDGQNNNNNNNAELHSYLERLGHSQKDTNGNDHQPENGGSTTKTTTTTTTTTTADAGAMAEQLVRLEKEAKSRLDGICQKAKSAWTTVERYEKMLETLQAQQTRALRDKQQQQQKKKNTGGGSGGGAATDAATVALDAKIRDAITTLSIALQDAAACDLDLAEWSRCVDHVVRVDVLRLYGAVLRSDIADTTQHVQFKALAVFQLDQHVQEYPPASSSSLLSLSLTSKGSTSGLCDEKKEDSASLHCSKDEDHVYESFFVSSTTPLSPTKSRSGGGGRMAAVCPESPSLDDTADESSFSSSSFSFSTSSDHHRTNCIIDLLNDNDDQLVPVVVPPTLPPLLSPSSSLSSPLVRTKQIMVISEDDDDEYSV
jgi:hypothetical protein